MNRGEMIGKGKAITVRQRVNLALRKDPLDQARSTGLNLPRALEESPAARLKRERQQRWLLENRAGIDEYTAYIEKGGCVSDTFRSF